MSQVRFVADQHDDDVCVGMLTELCEPADDVIECDFLGDIIDKQCSYCAAIISVENVRGEDGRWKGTQM